MKAIHGVRVHRLGSGLGKITQPGAFYNNIVSSASRSSKLEKPVQKQHHLENVDRESRQVSESEDKRRGCSFLCEERKAEVPHFERRQEESCGSVDDKVEDVSSRRKSEPRKAGVPMIDAEVPEKPEHVPVLTDESSEAELEKKDCTSSIHHHHDEVLTLREANDHNFCNDSLQAADHAEDRNISFVHGAKNLRPQLRIVESSVLKWTLKTTTENRRDGVCDIVANAGSDEANPIPETVNEIECTRQEATNAELDMDAPIQEAVSQITLDSLTGEDDNSIESSRVDEDLMKSMVTGCTVFAKSGYEVIADSTPASPMELLKADALAVGNKKELEEALGGGRFDDEIGKVISPTKSKLGKWGVPMIDAEEPEQSECVPVLTDNTREVDHEKNDWNICHHRDEVVTLGEAEGHNFINDSCQAADHAEDHDLVFVPDKHLCDTDAVRCEEKKLDENYIFPENPRGSDNDICTNSRFDVAKPIQEVENEIESRQQEPPFSVVVEPLAHQDDNSIERSRLDETFTKIKTTGCIGENHDDELIDNSMGTSCMELPRGDAANNKQEIGESLIGGTADVEVGDMPFRRTSESCKGGAQLIDPEVPEQRACDPVLTDKESEAEFENEDWIMNHHSDEVVTLREADGHNFCNDSFQATVHDEDRSHSFDPNTENRKLQLLIVGSPVFTVCDSVEVSYEQGTHEEYYSFPENSASAIAGLDRAEPIQEAVNAREYSQQETMNSALDVAKPIQEVANEIEASQEKAPFSVFHGSLAGQGHNSIETRLDEGHMTVCTVFGNQGYCRFHTHKSHGSGLQARHTKGPFLYCGSQLLKANIAKMQVAFLVPILVCYLLSQDY